MPAMASTFFNVASMAVGGLVGWWLDPGFGKTAMIGFAIGVLVGGLVQLAVQLPSLKKVGFRYGVDLDWEDLERSKLYISCGPLSSVAASFR